MFKGQQAKQVFWEKLERYQIALRSGDPTSIVGTSLAIHAALADVPKSYKRYVTQAYRNCGKEGGE